MSAEGLLVVDKPSGPTSHDIVYQARRLYGTRAVGHAGTLDPMASGVLVLLFGEATKLTPYLALDDKEYLATIAFGKSTDTLDALGRVTLEERLPDGWLRPDALAAAIRHELERTSQVPPSFSALSVGGERAHRKARRGEAVVLPPRDVRVLELRVESASSGEVVLRVRTSKGYYVRSLARDLSESLRVPGHLSRLVRTASGPYRLEEAVTWPPPAPVDPVPLAAAASRVLPCAPLTPDGVLRARQGKELTASDFVKGPAPGEVSVWLDPDGAVVAIGRRQDGGTFRVTRGFRAAST